MNRRDFTAWVSVGTFATFFPVALAACSDQKVTNKTLEWQEVGSVDDLDKSKQLLNEDLPVGKVLVIGSSTKSNEIIAVNPDCTHQGCTVAWESKSQTFLCPCHNSEFSKSGQVVKAPAMEALENYQVKLENGSVFVRRA